MEDFVRQLEKEQSKLIERIEAMDADNSKKALEASCLLGKGIYRLKDFICGYTFKDAEEEIRFFKEIKPRICSRLIYYRKIFYFEANRPVGNLEIQLNYIDREMAKIQEFIDSRHDFYNYYRTGSVYNDELYFMRNKQDLDLFLDTTFYERDPQFSTNCDEKVAKILAYDLLQLFLKSQQEELHHYKPKAGEAIYPKVGIQLKAKTSHIIELIYALHAVGAFGNASLKSVFGFIEIIFNVEVGNFSRTFAEIKLRNEPTPYLLKLIDALYEKMGRQDKKKR